MPLLAACDCRSAFARNQAEQYSLFSLALLQMLHIHRDRRARIVMGNDCNAVTSYTVLRTAEVMLSSAGCQVLARQSYA